MTPLQIFAVQFTLSLTIYALIAKWYVWPKLKELSVPDALIPLLLLHAFRHLGLIFLLPTVVGSTLPWEFAGPTAYGDLTTSILALIAVILLRHRVPGGIAVAWFTNLAGLSDFIYGFYQGVKLLVPLGAAYYIPIIANPAMYVAHFLIFIFLIRNARSGKIQARTI